LTANLLNVTFIFVFCRSIESGLSGGRSDRENREWRNRRDFLATKVSIF
jgi:hypothetical protein